ncbi:hypothetical protein [Lactococcus phage 3R16S]|uniref:Uncharacterized protein n=5 Tax=Skunavirus sv3R16S TaxID=2845163 RepID=A0A2H4FGR8_9CAUD|nr:hypothetical protein HYP03_gp28 [Lactococcus phage 3R16S]AOQ29182.1 hypothetical protein [Lactococcus phage 3R16S]
MLSLIKPAKAKHQDRSNWIMKDEFTYYTVTWIWEKEIKSRKFYGKQEAKKWFDAVESSSPTLKKHTEIIEVIA